MLGVLDGGTTNTRLRVWNGREVAFERRVTVGARDGAMEGGANRLRREVADLVGEARRALGEFDLVACGMIGSPSGLADVPHLVAPVTFDDLAKRLKIVELDEIGTVRFVPGVRTDTPDFAACDVMRGEETEVAGLRRLLDLHGPANFLHFGSHDKIVLTSDDAVVGSRTNLDGELLAALTRHTILAESATLPSEVDFEWWTRGFEAARAHGLSRAAFLTRLAAQRGATREEGGSFLLGVVAHETARLVPSDDAPLYLYGRATLTEPFARHLEGRRLVHVVPQATSDLAALHGVLSLLERSVA